MIDGSKNVFPHSIPSHADEGLTKRELFILVMAHALVQKCEQAADAVTAGPAIAEDAAKLADHLLSVV